MAKIVVIEGPDVGREFEVADLPATIGRDPSNAVPLADESVSRVHARLTERDGALWIVDEGSRNGTYVNGVRVESAPLGPDDRIGVGDTEVRLVGDRPRLEFPTYKTTIIRKADPGADPVRGLTEGPSADPARALERLRAVYDLLRAIEGQETAAGVLEAAVRGLREALGADRAAAIRFEGEGYDLVACAGGRGRRAAFAASRGALDEVRRRGEALLCRDAAPDEAPDDRESARAPQALSILVAPIRVEGGVWGALYLESRSRPFGDGDLYAATAAAAVVGPAHASRAAREAVADENRALVDAILDAHRIVGDSPPIRAVVEFIGRAAPTDSTVLILGETGTGKELVASAIHYNSPRRGKPFVVLNCAALPENLVESELFGHEKGAFTGAATRRKGRFEIADGGTVFLDEIAELAPACQAKLLRLLEGRTVERVGGSTPIPVDVRVIAATNRRIQEEMAEGRFREDLFYRLNVLSVTLPPLRERKEDIPGLVDHFLRVLGRRAAGGAGGIADEALRKLGAYAWPGNVRELRNVLERAVVLGRGPIIEAGDIEFAGTAGPAGPRLAAGATPSSLQEVEREHIERVLSFTGGNKKRAAEILGIERCTLYAKLKAHGIAATRARSG